MSHELRTPLNHILGFTELVVDKKFGDLNETQEEYLNDVLSSSKHLLSLINDILDLSKVEAGKLELESSDISLKTLLKNSLVMIAEKAMKHNIKLSTHIDGIPETITADERKLKQILYN
ncbi:MAG: two-component sensor histidine kinase, partial [Deltaproteobacteria bacterium]|nr:two-component sensor histidine kinase [Deltaproteobacteria bacterium]